MTLLGTWGREQLRPVSASMGLPRLQSSGPPAPHQAQLFRVCGHPRNREISVILPNKETSLQSSPEVRLQAKWPRGPISWFSPPTTSRPCWANTKPGEKEKCALLTENLPGGNPPISDLLVSMLQGMQRDHLSRGQDLQSCQARNTESSMCVKARALAHGTYNHHEFQQ